jgi:arabinosyltransferase
MLSISAAASAMPGKACRDVMHKVADKDGYIMVTWANNHYYDFVKNWVGHVESLGISAFAVGAMDNLILGQLLRDGIPCFSMQSGLTHKDYGWGSKSFHQMVWYPTADSP